MISGGNVSDEHVSPIYAHYLNHGGAAGVLGVPTSDEEEVSGAGGVVGKRQHFRGALYGALHSIAVQVPEEKVQVSCQREDSAGFLVESTIAWSAPTGAHVVHGEIRSLWLKRGGESGELGYPISDELPTPNGRGRRGQFQFGEIWWYPETGAVVQSSD
jgi:uncharacterized protein with LGFP repeats